MLITAGLQIADFCPPKSLQFQSSLSFNMATRWGIIGAGNISGQFVHDLLISIREGEKTHVIASIGCSNIGKGKDFLREHNVSASTNQGVEPKVESYDDTYANPDVDVIYIGTPHSFHKEQALKCLAHGKHLVCEKPFTVTGAEAREVFEYAKLKKLLVMEAMWTRFFPSVAMMRELIFEKKVLGDVHRLQADLSQAFAIADQPPTSRLRDINLAGGATLDMGIYPLTYARILLDQGIGKSATPFETKCFMTIDPTDGVDHVASILLKYENGKQAIITTSNHVQGPQPFLRLEGTKGTLMMYADNPAKARHFKIEFYDKSEPIEFEEDNDYFGFIYEANAASKAIQNGQTEVAEIPWDETLLVMDTMDKVRHENGFYYPVEKAGH